MFHFGHSMAYLAHVDTILSNLLDTSDVTDDFTAHDVDGEFQPVEDMLKSVCSRICDESNSNKFLPSTIESNIHISDTSSKTPLPLQIKFRHGLSMDSFLLGNGCAIDFVQQLNPETEFYFNGIRRSAKERALIEQMAVAPPVYDDIQTSALTAGASFYPFDPPPPVFAQDIRDQTVRDLDLMADSFLTQVCLSPSNIANTLKSNFSWSNEDATRLGHSTVSRPSLKQKYNFGNQNSSHTTAEEDCLSHSNTVINTLNEIQLPIRVDDQEDVNNTNAILTNQDLNHNTHSKNKSHISWNESNNLLSPFDKDGAKSVSPTQPQQPSIIPNRLKSSSPEPVAAVKKTKKQQLHCLIKGTGNIPVIMIHGLAMTSNFWVDGIIRQLKPRTLRKYTFYCPDIIGYGLSESIPSDDYYSAREQASRIWSDVIEKYHLTNFHLVGHSFGGIVSLHLATLVGVSRVRTITLLSPAYFASQQEACQLVDQFIIVSYPAFFRASIRSVALLERFIVPLALKLVPDVEMPSRALKDFLSSKADSVMGTVQSIVYEGADGPAAYLGDMGKRILLLHGAKDTIVPVDQAKHLALRYPNVEWREVAGGPHHFPLSHAAIVAPLLETEWQRAESSRRGVDDRWPSVAVQENMSALGAEAIANDRLRLFGI